jgi:hypothetical protein
LIARINSGSAVFMIDGWVRGVEPAGSDISANQVF